MSAGRSFGSGRRMLANVWRLYSLPDGAERRRNLDFTLRSKSRGTEVSPPSCGPACATAPRIKSPMLVAPGQAITYGTAETTPEAGCSACSGGAGRGSLPVLLQGSRTACCQQHFAWDYAAESASASLWQCGQREACATRNIATGLKIVISRTDRNFGILASRAPAPRSPAGNLGWPRGNGRFSLAQQSGDSGGLHGTAASCSYRRGYFGSHRRHFSPGDGRRCTRSIRPLACPIARRSWCKKKSATSQTQRADRVGQAKLPRCWHHLADAGGGRGLCWQARWASHLSAWPLRSWRQAGTGRRIMPAATTMTKGPIPSSKWAVASWPVNHGACPTRRACSMTLRRTCPAM